MWSALRSGFAQARASVFQASVVVPVRGLASRKHKKYVALAKGYRGRANRCFRIAIQRVEKAWQHSYKHRKAKKRDFRSQWIQSINAGAREHGIPYGRFIAGMANSNILLNRKVLADLAATEPLSFKSVLDATCTHDPYLAALVAKQHRDAAMTDADRRDDLARKYAEKAGLPVLSYDEAEKKYLDDLFATEGLSGGGSEVEEPQPGDPKETY